MKTLSCLSVITALMLASLSCKDVLAPVSQQLPPVATRDSALAIPVGSVVLFGHVNPNGISTSYSWELGPTSQYGTQTPSKNIGAGSANISVRDTVSGCRTDSTYHYRIVAENSGGKGSGLDGIFTVPHTPVVLPVLEPGAPTQITMTGATLNAVINTAGKGGTYSFYYDLTLPYAVYNFETPEQSIPAGSGSTAVIAQLTNLAPGTTYHWIVAYTSAGENTTRSTDSVFTTRTTPVNPVELIVPTAVGTTWHYQYSYSVYDAPGRYSKAISGIHTWTIRSTSLNGSGTTLLLEDIRADNDSVRLNGQLDSAYATLDTVSFVITISPSSIVFAFPSQALGVKYKTVPRYLDGTDTYIISTTVSDAPISGSCTYKSGRGLSTFTMGGGGNQGYYESMSFIDLH